MLLYIAMGIALAAAVAGAAMGFVLLDSEGARRPAARWVRAHGAAGIGAAALLAGALATGPVRGIATGSESFGAIALALFFLAAPVGALAAWRIARKRRLGGLVAAAHATVAICGLALLVAYVALG